MTDLKLDGNHDLAVEGNTLVLIEGADEVTQRLRCRLLTFRGEWFLNEARGVPYYQEVFVKRNPPTRVEAAIKREILTTPGVLELLEYAQDINIATRLLTVTFKARATDGQIIDFSEAIP